MIASLATCLIIAALVVALWSAVLLLLPRPAGLLWLYAALAVLELALAVQAVLGIIRLIGTDRPVEGVTFVGYLIGALLVLPLVGWWSTQERSRWSVGVLLIGCLALPVMILRMNQLWNVHA